MNKLYNYIFLLLLPCYNSYAITAAGNIPRFVSLKVSEANIRTGPGVKFPIKWILIKKHIPLEILDHFDNWYKIRDEEHQEGWIHKNLISSARYFIISKDEAVLYKNPKRYYVLSRLESGVRGKIKSCRYKWCEVQIGKMNGWLKKDNMWGVYFHEFVK